MMEELARGQPNGLAVVDNGADDVGRQKGVLPLFTVGDMYASLCKRGTYAPFSARGRSQALF